MRGSGESESHKNLDGAIPYVYNCGGRFRGPRSTIGGEGQDPTSECGRLHRHHFLPSKFIDLLELETHPSGEPEGILLRFLVSNVPMAYPNTSKKKIPLVYPHSMSVKGVDGKFDFFPPGFRFCRSGALEP